MTSGIAVSYITLFSPNMERLAVFYNLLGLNLKPDAGWGGIYGYLDVIENNGQSTLFQIRRSMEERVNNVNLGFRVDNVGELFIKLLDMKFKIIRPGNDRTWSHIRNNPSSLTMFVVEDPDGRHVQINKLRL